MDKNLNKESVVKTIFRVNFSDLLGNKCNDETKMIVLEWMLQTGKKHNEDYVECKSLLPPDVA